MNKLTYFIVPIVAVTAGCFSGSGDNEVVTDPNLIPAIIDAVGAVGVAVGGPVAGLALIGTNVASALWGVFQKKRKVLTEKELDDTRTKYDTLEDVAATIVHSVEAVGNVQISETSGTLGSVIKSEVKSKLEKNNLYTEGREIITALKTGVDEALKEIDAKDE